MGTALKNITLEQLSDWISGEERKFPSLKPNTHARVRWINEGEQTPISILYLHGFSASANEISPVTERLADHFKANVFYSRLRGHGMDGTELAKATSDQWMEDAKLSLDIAKKVGKKVIVVATSTGATLAEWILRQGNLNKDIISLIYISPNFGLSHPLSCLMDWPYSQKWLPKIIGSIRINEAENDQQKQIWTNSYPVEVLWQIKKLVNLVVRSAPLPMNEIPMLVVYCEKDKAVSAKKTRKYMLKHRLDPTHWLSIAPKVDSRNHVIVGDAVMPKNNLVVESEMINFIQSCLKYSSL